MHTSYWEEYSIICCKSKVLALISWLSVVLQKGKVASLIPSQGTWERQRIDVSLSHLCFSPSLSFSLPLSLKIYK